MEASDRSSNTAAAHIGSRLGGFGEGAGSRRECGGCRPSPAGLPAARPSQNHNRRPQNKLLRIAALAVAWLPVQRFCGEMFDLGSIIRTAFFCHTHTHTYTCEQADAHKGKKKQFEEEEEEEVTPYDSLLSPVGGRMQLPGGGHAASDLSTMAERTCTCLFHQPTGKLYVVVSFKPPKKNQRKLIFFPSSVDWKKKSWLT